jgi:HEAT repeat protein
MWLAIAAMAGVVAVVSVIQLNRARYATEMPRTESRSGRVPIQQARQTSVAQQPLQNQTRSNILDGVMRVLAKGYSEAMGGPLDEFSVQDLIFNLKDDSLPWKIRRRLAWELAKRGTDETIAALKELAATASPAMKAVIAEALGHSQHPEARTTLLAMLREQDETVVQGAVRGLAALGDAEAVNALSAMLFDPATSASVRAAAALALGETKNPAAVSTLTHAFEQITECDLREQILAGLGKLPFDSTREFFQSFLDSAGAKPELRVAAIEALANGSDNTVPFMLKYARDEDPQVRAAAAWSLTISDTSVDSGNELAALLLQEQNAGVRTRLYQALVQQENYDFSSVLPVISAERDTEARLAGFAAWAGYCKSSNQSQIVYQFDKEAVPELTHLALSAGDLGERLNSVIALRRAGTPAAYGALQVIAVQGADARVVQAAQAALRQPDRGALN